MRLSNPSYISRKRLALTGGLLGYRFYSTWIIYLRDNMHTLYSTGPTSLLSQNGRLRKHLVLYIDHWADTLLLPLCSSH